MSEVVAWRPVEPMRRRDRFLHWIAAPMSTTTRSVLLLGGVVLPLSWHLALWALPVTPAPWQTGKLHDMLALVLSPQAGFTLYPLLLYAVVSFAVYLFDEKRGGAKFAVRLGVWSGAALMLWYCLVFAVTAGRLDLEAPVTLLTPLIVAAVQAAILLFLWAGGVSLKWFCRRVGMQLENAAGALLGVYGAAVMLTAAGIGWEASFVFLALFPLAICIGSAPVWAFLCFTFASLRLIMLEPAARRFSLAHLVVGTTWMALFFGACRWSIVLSLKQYSKLPLEPPTCYVATAAARGHRRFVGSFDPSGQTSGIAINRQLRVLKAFELMLRTLSPRGHRLLRRIYDWIGPRLASRIRNPWMADVAYVTLKPLEWLASVLLWCCLGRHRHLVDRLYTRR